MNIVIETGIPIPPPTTRGRWSVNGRECETHTIRDAFLAMSIGDSFLYNRTTIFYSIAQQLGIQIRTEKINGEGYRVWRIG